MHVLVCMYTCMYIHVYRCKYICTYYSYMMTWGEKLERKKDSCLRQMKKLRMSCLRCLPVFVYMCINVYVHSTTCMYYTYCTHMYMYTCSCIAWSHSLSLIMFSCWFPFYLKGDNIQSISIILSIILILSFELTTSLFYLVPLSSLN